MTFWSPFSLTPHYTTSRAGMWANGEFFTRRGAKFYQSRAPRPEELPHHRRETFQKDAKITRSYFIRAPGGASFGLRR